MRKIKKVLWVVSTGVECIVQAWPALPWPSPATIVAGTKLGSPTAVAAAVQPTCMVNTMPTKPAVSNATPSDLGPTSCS